MPDSVAVIFHYLFFFSAVVFDANAAHRNKCIPTGAIASVSMRLSKFESTFAIEILRNQGELIEKNLH